MTDLICPHSYQAIKADDIHFFVNDTGTVCDNHCGTKFCKNCHGEIYIQHKVKYINQISTNHKTICLGHDPNCGLDSDSDQEI